MSRRRWLGVATALVLAVAAAGTVLWLDDRAVADVSVEVEPSTYVLSEDTGKTLSAKVTNDSGRELTDVELRFTLDDPGGDYTPMKFSPDMYDPECGIEDPGVEPECVRAKKKAESQSCAATEVGEPARTAVVCDGDLPEASSEYAFDYHLSEPLPLFESLADVEDYPDLTIRAEVFVDGERAAADKERLSVDLPFGYGRLTVDDLPTDMAIDDPPSRSHDWSFSVANDTDTGVTGATITIQANSGVDLVEIGSKHEGCETEVTLGRARTEVTCTDVDIPAGQSLRVEMSMNVDDGGAARFADSGDERDGFVLLIDVLADEFDDTFASFQDEMTLATPD